jgi:hypothetical protein
VNTLQRSPGRVDEQRVAGVLYAVIIVLGLATELTLRTALVVPGDAVATAANLRDAEWPMRFVIVASIGFWTCEIAMTVLLYRLFRPVSEVLSLTAAAVRLTTLAIFLSNLLNLMSGLMVYREDATQALRFFDVYQDGYALGLILFGVNCLLTAYLLTRSGQVPLGGLLGLAGVGYLAASLLFFLVPDYRGALTPVLVAPALVAEVWFCLVLLRKRVRRSAATSD